jgi:hypothetical protein
LRTQLDRWLLEVGAQMPKNREEVR